MSIDDFTALLGLISLLAGVYLWLGLPAFLILLGIVLIYIGARMPTRTQANEPDQTTN
jgi:cytochrome c-type biogenesis protein CcmH/NrfF